jgi:hypothetical protein
MLNADEHGKVQPASCWGCPLGQRRSWKQQNYNYLLISCSNSLPRSCPKPSQTTTCCLN